MIFAKYEIKDIFGGTKLVETGDYTTTEETIKTAFRGMLKYDACIWVDGMRYCMHNYSPFTKNTATAAILEKTPYNDIFDYGETVLIDYNTALKQELKKTKII